MAEKHESSKNIDETPLNQDESEASENVDDFDPFFGVTECSLGEYTKLEAPPMQVWYHGKLERSESEQRLLHDGRSGAYLVRKSETKPGTYVLSFYGNKGFDHFRISAVCGDYYLGGRQYNKLSDLVGYYTNVHDLLKDERLLFPVAPPEPVYDMRKVMAIIPYTPMADTDELGFEKGEIFIVQNDLMDGWLWVTAQDDGRGGIVNKELVQEINGNVDPVISKEWYWDDISKEAAVDILSKNGPGSWLVRPSDSSKGDYTLFFYSHTQITRFKIKMSGRHYSMGGRKFNSIEEITERYQKEQIVEGKCLERPAVRKKTSANSQALAQGIYTSMRQSSGSNFFLNRKDAIVKNGYLNKKSKSSKKWKKMYCVLNATEMQLFYFENQKRSKPKGLIDLNYSDLYPVHDSYFDRPNCFQIVTRGLNHAHVTEVVYICADSTDLAQDWFQGLKHYCQNTRPKEPISGRQTRPRHTELRSLQLKIFDAKKLPTKSVPHPHCIVSLNDVKVCRTRVKETVDSQVCWDEEFSIDDIPPDIESISMSIYNPVYNKVRRKDIEMLSIRVPLSDLSPDEAHEQWYPLTAISALPKGETSHIRVKLRYMHEIIMPLPEYNSLKELLCDKELKSVCALASFCRATSRSRLASSLLQIFRHQMQEAFLLKNINDREIENEDEPSQLFRGASMATAIMDQYMKLSASEFVHKALASPIQRIMDNRQPCDIVPCSTENLGEVEANAQHLLRLLGETVESIFQSAQSCPLVLRHICWCLQQKAREKWPDNALITTRVVSCFIFLRLLCPAILNPRQFNLITDTPSVVAVGCLKQVANLLIKLANLSEYKDPHTEEIINPYLRANQSRLINFLNQLSDVRELRDLSEPPYIDIARALATIHHLCSTHLEELQQPPYEDLNKLFAVTKLLTSHKKTYMEQT